MSSQRPVYIPRKRRAPGTNNTTDAAASTKTGNDYHTRRQIQKQQQPRFHGAFTGGFSAGYFNTVGTKEGWKPSETKKRDQRLEDFMDDEDHANWGGPTRLRDEYGSKTSAPTEPSTDDHITSATKNDSRTPFLPVKSMLEISHQTVGPRLLRRLGWREGGSVIVPENTTNSSEFSGNGLQHDGNTLENLAKVHLSRRKLRKIRLQSSRVSLPPPKLDQCGLGFEPYKDAPEFQRYREKRKQQAQERASYNSRDNVYRVSDVASKVEENDNSGGREASVRYPQESNSGEYLSYETAEDFVGKRSAAGFALRDDEDNAYDDDHTTYDRQNGKNNGGTQSALPKAFSVGDEYNTEVYEHESSDEDDYGRGGVLPNASSVTSTKIKRKESVDIGNMFASWAGTDQPSSGQKSSSVQRAALTSDGRPPLKGFVLGDSMDINKRRYPGPDIPRDYTIQRHEFGEHENPYVLEAISNAVRLEQKEERRSQLREPQSQQRIQQKQESSRPLSNNFSALAEAMKSRFTSSTEETSKKGDSITETSKALPAGLHMPRPVENKEDDSKNATLPKSSIKTPKITITRTVGSFFPNPLVCKRFRVPIPTNARRNSSLISFEDTKNKESAYFEKEILGKAKEQQKKEKKVVQDVVNNQKQIPENQEEETPKGIDRPLIENLRKIYQASSDESSSSEDEDSFEDSKTGVDRAVKDNSGSTKHDNSRPEVPKDDAPSKEVLESQEMAEYRPSSSKKEAVDSASSSRSGDSDDDNSSRARSRKRKKSKHRRKDSRHRKRHKRKRSKDRDHGYYSGGSSSRDEDDDDEGRREDRRSREHKRRKKKKSSSKHKSRKRDKAEKR